MLENGTVAFPRRSCLNPGWRPIRAWNGTVAILQVSHRAISKLEVLKMIDPCLAWRVSAILMGQGTPASTKNDYESLLSTPL